MRNYEFLSPVAKATLAHLRSIEHQPEQEFPLPAVIISMRKQGYAIGQTLSALNECALGGWVVKYSSGGRQPDRVGLSNVASVALDLETGTPGPATTARRGHRIAAE